MNDLKELKLENGVVYFRLRADLDDKGYTILTAEVHNDINPDVQRAFILSEAALKGFKEPKIIRVNPCFAYTEYVIKDKGKDGTHRTTEEV